MRDPSTKQQYTEQHGVSYSALKRWEKLPHFRAAYDKFVRDNIATPERVQFATDYAFRMAYESELPSDQAIKWANHYADLAGLKKTEPMLQKSAAEAMQELSDEELEALMFEAAAAEAKRRKSG
jgi:diphthamide synthase (EF-2-diphthine--ammonia ligase)